MSRWMPGQGFFNDSTNTPSSVQTKLFGMHKRPLITPRASTSSSSSSASHNRASTQLSLASAFKRKPTASTSSTARRSQSSKGSKVRGQSSEESEESAEEARDESGEDDEEEEDEEPNSSHRRHRRVSATTTSQTKRLKGILGGPISSNRLGKSIINPTQPRRGPTIDFYHDEEGTDASEGEEEDSMKGESQRKRNNRVYYGGKGELDLVPERDSDLGRGSSSSSRRRSEIVSRDVKASASIKRPLAVSSSSAKPSANAGRRRIYEDGDFDATRSQPSKRPYQNPATSEGSPVLSANARRTFSQRSRRASREVSATPSAGEPDTESEAGYDVALHRKIKSQRSFGDSSGSEDDRTLQQQLVRGRDADCGLTFDLGNDKDDEEEEARLDVLAAQLGQGGFDDSGFAEVDEKDEMILPSSQFGDRILPLERSESSVLMPPPPLPCRARSFPSTSPTELVPDSPPQQSTSHLQSPNKGTQVEDSLFEFETIYPLPELPIEQSPKRVRRAAPVSTWHSLEQAWSGARPLTPPPPGSPVQSKLFDFFTKPISAEVDEDMIVIEDSQPVSGLPLDQLKAFQAAFETTRSMGRKPGLEALAEVEEAIEEDFKEEEERVVSSSDHEDEANWSPLGSPVKMRFPPVIELEPLDEPIIIEDERGEESLPLLPSLPISLSQSSIPPSSQKPLASDGEQEEETQWESYWSVEAPQPSPFEELIDDAVSL